MGTVEVRKIYILRAGESHVPHRVEFRKDDDGPAVSGFAPKGRARGDGDEQGGVGPHEPRPLDINPVLIAVEMAVSPFGRGQVHEIPSHQGLRKRKVGMDAGGGQLGAVEVDATLQVPTFGQVPPSRDRAVINLDGNQQIPLG